MQSRAAPPRAHPAAREGRVSRSTSFSDHIGMARLASQLSPLYRPRLFPIYWIVLSSVVAGIDFWLGPHFQFPIAFVLPVGLAGWFSGRAWGIALGIALPLVRLYFVSIWDVPREFDYAIANAGIRMAILVGLALLVDRVAQQERELAKRVQALEGLLPICSGCKKIRDEEETWQPLETYISERSRAQFTHGFCPHCAEKYFGSFAADPD